LLAFSIVNQGFGGAGRQISAECGQTDKKFTADGRKGLRDLPMPLGHPTWPKSAWANLDQAIGNITS